MVAAQPSRFIAEMALDQATVKEDPREKLKALRAEFARKSAASGGGGRGGRHAMKALLAGLLLAGATRRLGRRLPGAGRHHAGAPAGTLARGVRRPGAGRHAPAGAPPGVRAKPARRHQPRRRSGGWWPATSKTANSRWRNRPTAGASTPPGSATWSRARAAARSAAPGSHGTNGPHSRSCFASFSAVRSGAARFTMRKAVAP